MRLLFVLLAFIPLYVFAAPEPASVAPKLTWEHDCKDIDGNDETLASWRVKVLDPDDAEMAASVLPDENCELREWQLAPINGMTETDYRIELRAVDRAGNESDPGVATMQFLRDPKPNGPTGLVVEVNCPVDIPCRVIINGAEVIQ